jgi:hypothetical protein
MYTQLNLDLIDAIGNCMAKIIYLLYSFDFLYIYVWDEQLFTLGTIH